MLDDRVRTGLCVGNRVNTQLRRVSRRPDMRDVAVRKVEPEAVGGVDVHDIVEAELARK